MTLREARALLRRGAWAEARAAFQRLAASDGGGPALDGLASALWWLDEPHRSIEVREAAYRAFRDRGEAAAAARMAMRLAVDNVDLGNDVVALGGWMARAVELLAPLDESIDHGWLALWQSHGARVQGDLSTAAVWRSPVLALRARTVDARDGTGHRTGPALATRFPAPPGDRAAWKSG